MLGWSTGRSSRLGPAHVIARWQQLLARTQLSSESRHQPVAPGLEQFLAPEATTPAAPDRCPPPQHLQQPQPPVGTLNCHTASIIVKPAPRLMVRDSFSNFTIRFRSAARSACVYRESCWWGAEGVVGDLLIELLNFGEVRMFHLHAAAPDRSADNTLTQGCTCCFS